MRLQRMVVVAAVLLLTFWIGAQASTLEEKKFEWAFRLSASSVDDVGDFSEYGFRWGAILGKGYHEVGGFISAFSNDWDDPFIQDETGSVIGPFYMLHFTPGKTWGSGFLFVAVGDVGGDTGDFFKSATEVGIGIKAIVGNSAAVTVAIERQTFQGEDFVEDREATIIWVALSLFSHSH